MEDAGPPRGADYLAWEEKRRLLEFRAGGLAKGPPGGRPRVSRYVWSPGLLVDVTCAGCGSSGCNRCGGAGRDGARVRWASAAAAGRGAGGWRSRAARLARALGLARGEGAAR